ncbi:hypothetical protein Nmel_018359 [Mimus melanotis]
MAHSFFALQFACGSRSTPRTRASSRAFPRSGRLLISSLPTPFSILSSSILLAELGRGCQVLICGVTKGAATELQCFWRELENKSRSPLSSQLPPGQTQLSCCPLGWHRVRIYGFLALRIYFLAFIIKEFK